MDQRSRLVLTLQRFETKIKTGELALRQAGFLRSQFCRKIDVKDFF
jgi:hypothetical protein